MLCSVLHYCDLTLQCSPLAVTSTDAQPFFYCPKGNSIPYTIHNDSLLLQHCSQADQTRLPSETFCVVPNHKNQAEVTLRYKHGIDIPDICLTPLQKRCDHNYPIPANVHVSVHTPINQWNQWISVQSSMNAPQIY